MKSTGMFLMEEVSVMTGTHILFFLQGRSVLLAENQGTILGELMAHTDETVAKEALCAAALGNL